MKQLWFVWRKTQKAIIADPIMLSMTVVVVVFGCFSVVESIRADDYQNTADDFKKSVKVQSLLRATERLSALNNAGDTVQFCSLSVENLFKNGVSEESSQLLGIISRDALVLQKTVPLFNSAAVYLPNVQKSRVISGEFDRSIEQIIRLATPSTQSKYCENLATTLAGSSFLQVLGTSEGVSALFVGQIENFWVNLQDVQDNYRNISNVPAKFAEEHAEINRIYNELALALREDTNQTEEFSKKVNGHLRELDEVFDSILQKSADLQQLLEKIELQATFLQ